MVPRPKTPVLNWFYHLLWLYFDSIHILFLLHLLLWFCFPTQKPAGFHQNYQGTNQGHLSGSRGNP